MQLLIAPGIDGTAAGSLYLDDGESLEQDGVTEIDFKYSADGKFSMDGTFNEDPGVSIESIVLLGQQSGPSWMGNGVRYSADRGSITYNTNMSLTRAGRMQLVST